MMKDALIDGSKGWNLMVSATNNDLINNPKYYSAWYFCKNYGTNNSLITLNDKWYFPTVSEMKEFKNTFATVNSRLQKSVVQNWEMNTIRLVIKTQPKIILI